MEDIRGRYGISHEALPLNAASRPHFASAGTPDICICNPALPGAVQAARTILPVCAKARRTRMETGFGSPF